MAAKSIWFNGELIPPQQAKVSVYDHGLLYGDGVFEGIRVYGGKVLKMRTHLKRLYNSADSIRLTVPYALDELEQGIRGTVADNPAVNNYIRLCVTRGAGTLGLHPFRCENPNTFIIVDEIELYPPECCRDGMAIITATRMRNHPRSMPPLTKSMNYLNNILAKIEAIDAGVLEALMLNHEGLIGECTGDNVFIVSRGVLRTPPLRSGILEGVTRGVVLDLARDADIQTDETDVSLDDVYNADEIFLTGSAAEIIPVTKVDDRFIGDGSVGTVTRQLSDAYHQFILDPPED